MNSCYRSPSSSVNRTAVVAANSPARGARMKASEAFGSDRMASSTWRRSRSFDVGLLIPTSGAMGLLGPSAWACAQMARDDSNVIGGVEGREVRLSRGAAARRARGGPAGG